MTQKHFIPRNDSADAGPRHIAEFAGIAVSSRILKAGETIDLRTSSETAWLLMSGAVRGSVSGTGFAFERQSLFDESASCIHVSKGTPIVIEALADSEVTVYTCPNSRSFPARVFTPEEVPNEHRGAGQVAGRCLRFVRTIFDGSNSPDGAELVLGEVVTLPGGWSSYPPHHHRQPEIYHYRFTEPQGYGHAELGETVYKVRDGDTVCIPPGLDHAQCAAPGYGMYYSWVIRHLPGDPYTIPDFTEEHAWTMDRGAAFWWPSGIDRD